GRNRNAAFDGKAITQTPFTADHAAAARGDRALSERAVHEQRAIAHGGAAGERVHVVEPEYARAALPERGRSRNRAAAVEGVVLRRVDGHRRGSLRTDEIQVGRVEAGIIECQRVAAVKWIEQ